MASTELLTAMMAVLLDVGARQHATIAKMVVAVRFAGSMTITSLARPAAIRFQQHPRTLHTAFDRAPGSVAIDPMEIYRSHSRRVLDGRRVAMVAIDWLSLRDDSMTVLLVAVCDDQGRATPLLALSVATKHYKRRQRAIEAKMLPAIRGVVPVDMTVISLADRAFDGAAFRADAIAAKLHCFIRVRGNLTAWWNGKKYTARKLACARSDRVRRGSAHSHSVRRERERRKRCRTNDSLTALARVKHVRMESGSMSLLRGDENWIRGTLAHVLHARRDLMMESLDRLVRQCDAKIPRVAPSLFDAPLTERRWLAFLRAEEVRARWNGDEFQKLAAIVRLATRHPRCKTLEEIVERWLPDEDALREVVVATRPAVHTWWNDPSTTFESATLRALYDTLEPHEQLHCTVARVIASARDELGDELDRAYQAELARTRDPVAVQALSARSRAALATRDPASVLLRAFDAIAQGYTWIGFGPSYFYDARKGKEALRRDELNRAEATRTHYPTLDLERLWRAR